MDVDIALLGVCVGFVQAGQPKNACQHQVLLTALGSDLAGRRSTLEDGTDWGARSDFLADDEATKGRLSLPGSKPRPNFEVETGYDLLILPSRNTSRT